MSLGPAMIDVEGVSLTEVEKERLAHPLVGGVILFSRNYQDHQQLQSLIDEIHQVNKKPLLIAVDHEGGRVQRFRDGFTHIPAAAEFGSVFDMDKRRARLLAELAGWVLASELRAVGVDFSFTPVLDLNYEKSIVIGDRSFHRNPDFVSDLASHLITGLKKAGMAAVGKHFPGHGYVEADSHVDLPVDHRSIDDIRMDDLIPFERMTKQGLDGVMPAHVIYDQVDPNPAGFSRFWLQTVLRKEINFQGVIFSDDLSMEGARSAGNVVARANAAMRAGCDMILVCNDPDAVDELLDGFNYQPDPVLSSRLVRLHGMHPTSFDELHASKEWHKAVHALHNMESHETLELDFG